MIVSKTTPRCKKARQVSILKMKQCANVENAVDCAMRAQMKSRILDSEDTALLAIAGFEKRRDPKNVV